jgi:phosphopantetheinyl transferase
MSLESLISCENNTIAYAVWRITESEEELRQLLATTIDPGLCNVISHPIKRKEWLATRLAYQYLCKRMDIHCYPIHKNTYGKPYLAGDHTTSPLYVSLSHSFPFVAAILSTQTPIGIDIQRPNSKLLRIQNKYLSPAEIVDSYASIEKLCIYWCAKEAIYKAYVHTYPFPLSYIHIPSFIQALQGTIEGQTPDGYQYMVYYTLQKDYILTWCQEKRFYPPITTS